MKTTKSAITVSLFFCILLFAGWAPQAMALTCTSLSTGNWNFVARWSCGRVPIAADTAVIANTHTVTVTANAVPVGAVTVNAGGILNVGGFNFTVNGATAVSGTLAHVTSTNGTKTYIGLVTINAGGVWNNAINEAATFRGGITHNGATFTGGTGTQTFDTNNQAIGGASPINFGGVVAVGGNRTVTNNNTNVVTIAGNLTGGNANSTWVNGANSTLNYGGSATPMSTGVLTASAAGNTVNYTRAGTQTVKLQNATYFNLSLSGNNTKTIGTGGSQTLTVAGNLTIGAGVTYNGTTRNPAVNLAGNFSNSGTFNAGTGLFTFNGAAAQTLTGATTFTNMRMNNTSTGLTINSNVTVSTSLTLTSGVIATGANTLIASANCPGSVSRTSGHIAGNLRLTVPATNPVTCTFHVGDANNYAPITVTKTGANSGTLTGSSTAGDHADTTSGISGIDKNKSVNRYWTLTGVTLASGTPYSATFQFCNGTGTGCGVNDVDVGANTANFIVAKKTGGAWTTPAVGTKTSTSTQATGLSTYGDFVVGEAKNPNFSREPQFIYTRERY